MVKVKAVFKHNAIIEIQVCDHSGSADRGQDLVCAGVSSICVGILNALDKLCEDTCVLEMKEAYVGIKVKDLCDEKAQVILHTMYIQLQTMEHSYQKFIQITKAEV